jgi:hypothetical protein
MTLSIKDLTKEEIDKLIYLYDIEKNSMLNSCKKFKKEYNKIV